MASKLLWILTVPLALVGWFGVALVTGAYPPTPAALVYVLPLLLLAVTMTSAPLIWLVGRKLHSPGVGKYPGLAFRSGFWVGIWAAGCVALRFTAFFSWIIALTLAMILMLLEAFLQQIGQRRIERGN